MQLRATKEYNFKCEGNSTIAILQRMSYLSIILIVERNLEKKKSSGHCNGDRDNSGNDDKCRSKVDSRHLRIYFLLSDSLEVCRVAAQTVFIIIAAAAAVVKIVEEMVLMIPKTIIATSLLEKVIQTATTSCERTKLTHSIYIQ